MSRNQYWNIQKGYGMILECSLNICFDSGGIRKFKVIPILAEFMIVDTPLFYIKIQSKQIISKVNINKFFYIYINSKSN